MTQRHWTLEIKVGAFVILGLVLFVMFIFAIGDISTAFVPSYQVNVVFDSANGINDGSPVQYAGVEIGKVESVHLVPSNDRVTPHVELVTRLPSYVKLRSDDQVAISTFGLLGEKYLAITPGPGVGRILNPHDQLVGQPPVSTELVIQRSNEVLTELKSTLQGINTLVGDPEARLYLKETVREARDATRNWKVLGERLNLAMSYAESGQGNVGKLLFDDDLYQRMSGFVDDVKAHPWKLFVRPPRGGQQSSTKQK